MVDDVTNSTPPNADTPAAPSPVPGPAPAPSPVPGPAPAPIDPKTSFLSLSLDGQASALFDHLAAVAVAVGELSARVDVIASAPVPVPEFPAEFESVATDVATLKRHVFGA